MNEVRQPCAATLAPAATERVYVHFGGSFPGVRTGTGAPSGALRRASPGMRRHAGVALESAPSAELRDHVALLQICDEWIPPDRPVAERVLPDGAVHLLFSLGPAGATGEAHAGEPLAIGATCRAEVVPLAGRIEGVAVRLRPGGVEAVLGVPSAAIAEGGASLEDLWGPLAREAVERIAQATTPAGRIAATEQVLLRRVRAAGGQCHGAAAEAVRRIDACGGRTTVRALAAGLGVSERRLEQLFQRHVGITPKAACRIARFRSALMLSRNLVDPDWSRVALRCGYYDQSHLVNEFRALSGLTPGDLKDRVGFAFFQDTPV